MQPILDSSGRQLCASAADFVSQRDLLSLPRWAQVAFVVRCAQRVLEVNRSLLEPGYDRLQMAQEVIEDRMREASTAGAETVHDSNYSYGDLDDWFGPIGFLAESHLNDAVEEAYHYLTQTVGDGISRHLRDDYQALQKVSSEEAWNDSTPVPESFFALNSIFDLQERINDSTIIEISSRVNERLLAYFRRHPERLYQLNPRQFEEVIAEIWDAFGFQVELTKRTRDGGKDIIAISCGPQRLMYLIECKRYGPNRPVGSALVQRLFGVSYLAGADRGLLVTTSRFTQPAQMVLRQANWLLEGYDFHGIRQWLEKYQAIQMHKHLGLLIDI